MPYYAVRRGFQLGVFSQYENVRKSILGHPNPKFRKFSTHAAAWAWYTNPDLPDPPPPTPRMEIFTDGCCLDNGGDQARAGVGVYFDKGDVRNISQPLSVPPHTNNRAEYEAALLALQWVLRNHERDVKIWSDSRLLVSTYNLWMATWEKNDWKKSDGKEVMNLDLVRQLAAVKAQLLEKGISVQVEWCKGHAKNIGNEGADALAKAGALQK